MAYDGVLAGMHYRCPKCMHIMDNNLEYRLTSHHSEILHSDEFLRCCYCFEESPGGEWVVWTVCPKCRHLTYTFCVCISVRDSILCCKCKNYSLATTWYKFMNKKPDNIDLLSYE